jgi:hypothetical protein
MKDEQVFLDYLAFAFSKLRMPPTVDFGELTEYLINRGITSREEVEHYCSFVKARMK